MKVLLLGFSSIAQRRIIPALARLDGIECVDIASKSKRPAAVVKPGRVFTDYGDALAQSDADLVYISLPNSLHEQWITASLDAGKHVVVDKPATLTLEGARRLTEHAAACSKLIAEATVFSHHSHMAGLLRLSAECGPLTQIDAQFIIPPLPNENFRTVRAMGGGCLFDMGPYAAAVARLFGTKLESICAIAAPAYTDADVDMGFSLAARFSDGLRYTGHFSFESEYQNRLLLIGRNGSIQIERVFSPPADVPVVWQVRRRNKAEEVVNPADDTFLRFLSAVIDAINSGQHARFTGELLADAIFREEIAKSLRN